VLEESGEAEGPDLERLCQAVSTSDERCDYPATVPATPMPWNGIRAC
jgi:hypothetical protein